MDYLIIAGCIGAIAVAWCVVFLQGRDKEIRAKIESEFKQKEVDLQKRYKDMNRQLNDKFTERMNAFGAFERFAKVTYQQDYGEKQRYRLVIYFDPQIVGSCRWGDPYATDMLADLVCHKIRGEIQSMNFVRLARNEAKIREPG